MSDAPADHAARNAAAVRARSALRPRIGIVLGSGLGGFAAGLADAVSIPYAALGGFPAPSVSGHSGALVLGRVAGEAVAVLSGRAHYYEHGRADAMRVPLETLAALGVGDLVLTNAAGSLRPEHPPGSVMLLSDHINFAGINPLIGEPSEARFVGMTEVYDAALRRAALAVADAEGITLHEGV
jgi:purine-nucleoside phosphorylase